MRWDEIETRKTVDKKNWNPTKTHLKNILVTVCDFKSSMAMLDWPTASLSGRLVSDEGLAPMLVRVL